MPDLSGNSCAPRELGVPGNRAAASARWLMPGASYERIYAVVRRIPRGRVATYGQVAALAGLAGQARLVGYAMHALSTGTAVPWQRVINARGMVSARSNGDSLSQRMLLEREGVVFDGAGRTSLVRFGWKPANSRTASRSRRR